MNFAYKAKTRSGEIIDGKIDASDQNKAVDTLQSKGYIILSVESLEGKIFTADLNQYFSRPDKRDIVIFTRQLSTLIDADVPLVEGLRTLARQIEKPAFKKIVNDISDAVEAGSSLSIALSAHPKAFSSFYIKLVQSGEVSGKLQNSLLYLASYLERTRDINTKIRGALTYPAFVVMALLIVGMIMVVYVLPQLLSIFEEVGAESLPLTTRILITVTEFINNYLYYLIIFILGLAFFAWQYIKTASGKNTFDYIKINAPTLGPAVRNLYLARMSESLSTLIKSGIPILDALHITASLVENVYYERVLLAAEKNVRGGGTISEIFIQSKEIPLLMSSMVEIGEKTGKLDYILEHISKFYKTESDTVIDNISQLIEPILVLILGVAVAGLVSAILLPIYNLVGVN